MKTTIDLPEDLVRDLKLRAVRERRKLKEIAAELLRIGLSARTPNKARVRIFIRKSKVTGLPVIHGSQAASGKRQPTPEEMAQVLIDQEADWALGGSSE